MHTIFYLTDLKKEYDLINNDCGKYLSKDDYIDLNGIIYKIDSKTYDYFNDKWILYCI